MILIQSMILLLIQMMDSCSTLVVFGCTDDSYTEYDPANTDDDSCSTLVVLGCTDSNYLEYDPAANTDDDSFYISCIWMYR